MFRKSTLLAVAATAALGFALLNPTLASAKGHGGGHGRPSRRPPWWSSRSSPSWSPSPWSSSPSPPRPSPPSPPSLVRALSPADLVRRLRRTIAARPVAGPCTCLSKEYTPQGQVLFKDRCTNEAAINPPLQQQGAAEMPQQSCRDLPAGACEPAAAAAGSVSQTLLVSDGEPRPCAGVLCYCVFSRDSTRALLAMSLCRRCRNPAASR